MERAVWIIAVSLVGAALGNPPPSQIPRVVAENRDLRAYEDGGVYHRIDHNENIGKLRDFIWTHWTQKRRGYVEVVFSGTDAGIHSYLFIEPINGRWGIAWCDIPYSVLSQASDEHTWSPAIRAVERCRGHLIFFDTDDSIVKYL